jgi:16S rRNA (adenine1518-N6/adenine1519-N6)-dimethyltransferase
MIHHRRKRFGQHFLTPEWTRKLLGIIQPRPDETFLEIGPGPGALTLPLAARAARVVAIEIDRDLAGELRRRVPGNVDVVQADVLRIDLEATLRAKGIGPPVRVAGNLPYNVSSPILFRLLEVDRASGLFTDGTLMLQREVVDRLVARPGTKDYGVLSVLTQLQADVSRALVLPPGAFRPPPKVWSAVVRLVFRQPNPEVRDLPAFERLVKGLFMQRRKTMLNSLKAVIGDGGEARAMLEAAGIDPSRRPETLDLPELVALSELRGSSDGRAVL